MAIHESWFFSFFSYKIAKNWKQNKKSFLCIAFDLIQILKSWASQKDPQILIFVKAINVVGKTWPEIVLKLLGLSDSFPIRVYAYLGI